MRKGWIRNWENLKHREHRGRRGENKKGGDKKKINLKNAEGTEDAEGEGIRKREDKKL